MSPTELNKLLHEIQKTLNDKFQHIPEFKNYQFVFVDLLENDIRP